MTPIVEQIAAKIKTRLGLISSSSGYETTASGVVRPTRTGGFRPKDYQLIVVQESATKNQQLSCPGNPPSIAWNQPFRIAAELLQSKNDTSAIDTLRNTFAADVQKALTTATGDWAQWDGLAVNSMIGQIDTYLDDGETNVAGFQIVLTVIYRVSENDPYTVRA